MKTSKLFILFILGIVLISCDFSVIDHESENYEYDWFPEFPVNIVELNTKYDDFNSDIERIGRSFDLYYSTNRNSKGKNFDIACGHFEIFVNYKSKNIEFEIIKDQAFWSSKILPVINSGYNELGPFSFEWRYDKNDSHGNWLFLYANDSTGNFNIRFININITEWVQGKSHQKIYGPVYSEVFNSASNDYYPTINSDFSQFYFCSDRNGSFDIFKVDISNPDIKDWLETGHDKAIICNSLSGKYNDKCPYIKGNLLVFASDRKNGYGGFDLWYSVYENNEWSEPVNFGPNINTKYDEYRPVIEYYEDSKNDLMIFSSNRPSGMGGYDLYYTGITKMIK